MEEYSIKILQEPVIGRMCGFTNLPDRRMLDPPLVVQLSFKLRDTIKDKDIDSLFNRLANRFLCHVTLSEVDTKECRNTLKRLKWTSRVSKKGVNKSMDSIVPILFGGTCLNGMVMNDMETEEKCVLFVFADLSVRVQGEFRICLNVLDMEDPMRVKDSLYTNPIKVYTPKQFPGMLVSSELTRYQFQQGVSVRRRECNYTEQSIYKSSLSMAPASAISRADDVSNPADEVDSSSETRVNDIV